MKKRAIISAAVCCTLVGALLFTGCNATTAVENEAKKLESEAAKLESEVVKEFESYGQEIVDDVEEWVAAAITGDTLTTEENEIFGKATKGLTDATYAPVATLATQVVSGTNYAFLCLSIPNNDTEDPEWKVITVYNDLEGNVEITANNTLDCDNLKVLEDSKPSEVIPGSWVCALPTESLAVLPTEAEAAFKDAAQQIEITLNPVTLLRSETKEGTTYEILCDGSDGTNHGAYVVKVTVNGGKCVLDSCVQLDVAAYTTPSK